VKDFSFRDQIRRAALSIILNIAEGSAKKSDKDFAKFLEISVASANEVTACLDIMHDLKKISDSEFNRLLAESDSIVKQLGGFIKKLRK
jgi:four helix bundle protein